MKYQSKNLEYCTKTNLSTWTVRTKLWSKRILIIQRDRTIIHTNSRKGGMITMMEDRKVFSVFEPERSNEFPNLLIVKSSRFSSLSVPMNSPICLRIRILLITIGRSPSACFDRTALALRRIGSNSILNERQERRYKKKKDLRLSHCAADPSSFILLRRRPRLTASGSYDSLLPRNPPAASPDEGEKGAVSKEGTPRIKSSMAQFRLQRLSCFY